MLTEGTKAPALTAVSQFGETVSVPRDFKGKWVLLWWYPKAMTPGCTSCGQAFAKRLTRFLDAGCEVVGVSYDSPEKNLDFAQRYRFSFPLLTATKEQAEGWETKRPEDDDWADLPFRYSYLIDPKGVIRKAYHVRDAAEHPAEVLADVLALTG